jgi:hypothetical protein
MGCSLCWDDDARLRWAEACSTREPGQRVEGVVTDFASRTTKLKWARRGEG